MNDDVQRDTLVRKMHGKQFSTASSSSSEMEVSMLPSEVLKLGSRIVRELRLEHTDTLGRWMAHHLAEVLQDVDSAREDEKELVRNRAVDLILKLWSHKRSLPGAAYPLTNLERAISVLARLSPDTSPFQWIRTGEKEKLLARVFDGLRLVVIRGVILISRTSDFPEDYEAARPFLNEDEQKLLDAFKSWKDYVRPDWPDPRRAIEGDGKQAPREVTQTEVAEEDESDPRTETIRLFSQEIDQVVDALLDLKKELAAEEIPD